MNKSFNILNLAPSRTGHKTEFGLIVSYVYCRTCYKRSHATCKRLQSSGRNQIINDRKRNYLFCVEVQEDHRRQIQYNYNSQNPHVQRRRVLQRTNNEYKSERKLDVRPATVLGRVDYTLSHGLIVRVLLLGHTDTITCPSPYLLKNVMTKDVEEIG